MRKYISSTLNKTKRLVDCLSKLKRVETFSEYSPLVIVIVVIVIVMIVIVMFRVISKDIPLVV